MNMEPNEILKSVNDFYQQAWDKLILYSTILIAFIGVIVPILFTLLQNRTQLIREDAIKKELGNFFDSKLKEMETALEASITKKFEGQINKINKKIDDKINLVDAGVYHIQGNMYFDKEKYLLAIMSYFVAGEGYLKGKDYANLEVINKNIKQTIPNLPINELKTAQEEDEIKPYEYISLLMKNNENGLFTDIIGELKKEMSAKLKVIPKAI